MYQKKFISLYFSANTLQLVKVNSKKSAIIKYATYGLPQGAIENHKVKDSKLITQAIQKIWSEMHIRDKTVGLVIPEFATFTKTLVLPKLDSPELDEAVRWQANELLPFEKGNAVLDWQIVRESDSEKVVLVSAISREVLTGYVDAVSGAGLYPLSVETPSISLIRIIGNDNKKRLIVYSGPAETIMLIAGGKSISGSSVLNTKDEQTVLNTAFQFVSHYSQGKIDELLLGGVPFSQDFYPKLYSNLGNIQPLQLNLPVQGLTPAQVQEYMVPLSQQMQDPQAPDDEKTTNLLPPSWVKHYQDKLSTRQSWSLAMIALGAIWVSLVTVVIAFVYLTTQLNNLKATSLPQDQISADVVGKVQTANAAITKLSAISAFEIYPQNYINAVTKAKPESITIISYSVNMEAGSVVIEGSAPTRQDLINFKQQLDENGDFAEVKIPISSLIAEENIDFKIDLLKEKVEAKKPAVKLKI